MDGSGRDGRDGRSGDDDRLGASQGDGRMGEGDAGGRRGLSNGAKGLITVPCVFTFPLVSSF